MFMKIMVRKKINTNVALLIWSKLNIIDKIISKALIDSRIKVILGQEKLLEQRTREIRTSDNKNIITNTFRIQAYNSIFN